MEKGVGQNIETLDYVAAMLGQLRDIAKANKNDMLAYLIDIAHIEASEELADVSAPVVVAGKQRNRSA